MQKSIRNFVKLTNLSQRIHKRGYLAKFEQVYFVHISPVFSCSVTIKIQHTHLMKQWSIQQLHNQLVVKVQWLSYIYTHIHTFLCNPFPSSINISPFTQCLFTSSFMQKQRPMFENLTLITSNIIIAIAIGYIKQWSRK